MKNEKIERMCKSIDNVSFDELQMLEDYIKLKKSEFSESEHDPKQISGLIGWICPVCGSALSPFANYCPFCNNKNTNWWDTNKIVYASDFTSQPSTTNNLYNKESKAYASSQTNSSQLIYTIAK